MLRRRQQFAFCAQTFILVLCSGCPQQESEVGSPPDAAQTGFTVVVSGDTHGWIMPCGCTSNQSGGLLRRGSYVNQIRLTKDVIVLDAGGAADGVAPYQLEKFRAVLKGERLLNVAAHNIGATELEIGAEKLRLLADDFEGLFISTNVVDENNRHAFASERIAHVNDTSIRILGVVSPRYAGAGFKVLDPAAAIFQVLSSTEISTDWVVVLAYLNEGELRDLAASLPEAHAIIGGPTNQALHPEKIGQVLLTSATNKGKFLAELNFNAQQKKIDASIVEMSPDYKDEEKQEQNLDEFKEILALRDFSADESGLLDDDRWSNSTDDQIAGTRACLKCHEETHQKWKSTGHAHAWARLVNEMAHYDSYCQQCHTTGYGGPEGFESVKLSPHLVNVGCESCHGPAQSHVENPVIKTPFDAKGQCMKCHDPENSPTFDFDSYWEKIHHE